MTGFLKNVACYPNNSFFRVKLIRYDLTLLDAKLKFLLCLRETHNLLQLPVFFFSFFFSFFCQPNLGLRNCKLVFLMLKISQYDGPNQWAQFFTRYPCKNWCKNWYLNFHKTYDHQIWQAGTSIAFDSNETNQIGACVVITSRSWDKLKT